MARPSVAVTSVASRADRRDFIELPFRLHAASEQWIPPLRLERHAFFSRRMNAFFKRGEACEFLARRGEEVVGRISAQVDSAFDGSHADEPPTGMFGFLELEDDPEILPALLDAARAWLRARGRARMLGPMDYTMNDESGVLIDGFEREPFIKQPWHPPHYQRLCEQAGLQKAMDLFMWELEISDREIIRPIIFRIAQDAHDKHGITLRKMTRRGLRKDMDIFRDVYNSAWKDNWDFVPFSDTDLDHYAQEFQLVFDHHWFMVAEKDGQPIGVALTFPDINQVLKKMQGNLLPLGWWHFLRKGATIDRVRVGFLGVKPEFQHTGAAAQMYIEHFDMAEVTPHKWGEMGWILETNRAMNRGMEAMGGRIVKRYRVYEERI